MWTAGGDGDNLPHTCRPPADQRRSQEPDFAAVAVFFGALLEELPEDEPPEELPEDELPVDGLPDEEPPDDEPFEEESVLPAAGVDSLAGFASVLLSDDDAESDFSDAPVAPDLESVR